MTKTQTSRVMRPSSHPWTNRTRLYLLPFWLKTFTKSFYLVLPCILHRNQDSRLPWWRGGYSPERILGTSSTAILRRLNLSFGVCFPLVAFFDSPRVSAYPTPSVPYPLGLRNLGWAFPTHLGLPRQKGLEPKWLGFWPFEILFFVTHKKILY